MAKEVTIKIDQSAGQIAIADGTLFLGENAPIKFTGCTLAKGESIRLVLFAKDGTTAIADNSTNSSLLDLRTKLIKKEFNNIQNDRAFSAYAYSINSSGTRTGTIDARGILPVAWAPDDFSVDKTPVSLKGEKGDKGPVGLPVGMFSFCIEELTDTMRSVVDDFVYYYKKTEKYYTALKQQLRKDDDPEWKLVLPPNAEYWKEHENLEDICDGLYGFIPNAWGEGYSKGHIIYDAHGTKKIYIALQDTTDQPLTNTEYWKQVNIYDLFNMWREVDNEHAEQIAELVRLRKVLEWDAAQAAWDIQQRLANIRQLLLQEIRAREAAGQAFKDELAALKKQAEDHINNKNNPHGITAKQIGTVTKADLTAQFKDLGRVKAVCDKTPTDGNCNIDLKAKDSLTGKNPLNALPAYDASMFPYSLLEDIEGELYVPPMEVPKATIGSITIDDNTIHSSEGYILFNDLCKLTINGSRVMTYGNCCEKYITDSQYLDLVRLIGEPLNT